MIVNYLKIFFRNILKRKTSAIINIAGLTLAICSCLFIMLFVQDELKYDQFNRKKDRICRYIEQSKSTGEKTVLMAAKNFHLLKDEIPEIESGFRMYRMPEQVLKAGQKMFVDDVYYADKEILDVFDFPLIKGDMKTALDAPFSVLLTLEMARKYFGSADPIGKTLRIEDKYDFRVTGILKDIPRNSHIKPSILASISTLNATEPQTMTSPFVGSSFFYFLLRENAPREGIENKLKLKTLQYFGRDWARDNNVILEPLNDIYLNPSGSVWDYAEHGDTTLVKSFIAIALLVLLMASFNYTNVLTTTIKIREKEIACRKLLGAGKRETVIQFVLETFVYISTSYVISAAAVILLLNGFNQISGKNITARDLLAPEIVFHMAMLLVLTVCLSVIYPLYIAFKSDALSRIKGGYNLISHSKYSIRFRHIVTGIQFSITIGLIIAVCVIYSQLQYASGAKLGFNKDHLLAIANPYGIQMYENYEKFRNKITQLPQVLSVSASENIPTKSINNFTSVFIKNRPSDKGVEMGRIAVDYGLLKTWQSKLISGRDFSREMQGDRDHAVIINRAAANALHLKNPVGTIVEALHIPDMSQQIIGVVEDIHFYSFRDKVTPTVFYLRPWSSANIMVRLRDGELKSTMNRLEREWKEIMPVHPFIYSFMEESFDKLYKKEIRTEKLLVIFSLLAIAISSFGLFNLISLIAQTKRKEIGVRKVLGASVSNVAFSMIKEFLIIILTANVIAWPVAYYTMSSWLRDFAYRITISPWVFILSAIMTLAIGFAAIIYQALRAAMVNPVHSLKYE
ncbi:MAG: FtsX-like permease family protein [Ignavibacteria bacterium]|nr:FtsX-like permease family protein [Ignavibacteria bacterium]MCU7504754.1 FtsX-like permease family protein [Ignavibacteria bacterium]MCU7516356.1 FtsX-like permease family protein [Ignavibacteria bacterium]